MAVSRNSSSILESVSSLSDNDGWDLVDNEKNAKIKLAALKRRITIARNLSGYKKQRTKFKFYA